MKLRCDITIGGDSTKLILVARPEEKLDHLAMKLAGVVMFMPLGPIVEPASDHPALTWLDVKPDVMALNEAGEIRLWVECGEVSINKLDKVARRMPETRVVVLKSQLHQAKQLRQRLIDDVRQGDRVEVWTWPPNTFNTWLNALEEKVEIFGEAHEKSFNLVVNAVPYAVDLISV